SMGAPSAAGPARCQGRTEMLQPTVERHGRFSLSRLVCDRRAGHLPGAQTERRGGAGPAGACLAVRTPPALLVPHLSPRPHGDLTGPRPRPHRPEGGPRTCRHPGPPTPDPPHGGPTPAPPAAPEP